jgi:hypothetical protein
LQIVADYYAKNFQRKVLLESVILLDDSLWDGVTGQNILVVPTSVYRNSGIFFVAAVLEELLTRAATPSDFLEKHLESGRASLITQGAYLSVCEKGLEVLLRMNKDVKLASMF